MPTSRRPSNRIHDVKSLSKNQQIDQEKPKETSEVTKSPEQLRHDIIVRQVDKLIEASKALGTDRIWVDSEIKQALPVVTEIEARKFELVRATELLVVGKTRLYREYKFK